MTSFHADRNPHTWWVTLRLLWANKWIRWTLIFFALWLLKMTPGWISAAIDKRDMRVVVFTSGANENPRGIHSFFWSSPLGSKGGDHAAASREPGEFASGSASCCSVLRLKQERTIVVEWEWTILKEEWDQGIRELPKRRAIVPIELEAFDWENLGPDKHAYLNVYFLQGNRVAARLSRFRPGYNPHPPEVAGESFEVPGPK